MRIRRTFTLLVIFLSLIQVAIGQNQHDLADGILVCDNGAIPNYISCEDSMCQENSYYYSGQIKATGKCQSGKKVGLWTAFHENGNTSSKGIIKGGFLYGEWEFYFENGSKKAAGEFKLGQFELVCAGSEIFNPATIMNGEWKFWNENGSLSSIYHFSPNEFQQETRNGEYISWYQNGQKKEEGAYDRGMKNGIWTSWFENGNTQKEEYYTYQDCGLYDYIWFECPSGTWTFWNENGTLLKNEIYLDGELSEEINQ